MLRLLPVIMVKAVIVLLLQAVALQEIMVLPVVQGQVAE